MYIYASHPKRVVEWRRGLGCSDTRLVCHNAKFGIQLDASIIERDDGQKLKL